MKQSWKATRLKMSASGYTLFKQIVTLMETKKKNKDGSINFTCNDLCTKVGVGVIPILLKTVDEWKPKKVGK